MRSILLALFTAILLLMVAATTWASLERSVFEAGDLLADRWFVATLCDAYCGFFTFYAWVAYRESNWTGRIIWFFAIMTLGNIAMAGYMLFRLWQWPPGAPWSQLLLNSSEITFPCPCGDS